MKVDIGVKFFLIDDYFLFNYFVCLNFWIYSLEGIYNCFFIVFGVLIGRVMSIINFSLIKEL